MTFLFIVIAMLTGGALALLLWSSRNRPAPSGGDAGQLNEESLGCKNAMNFQQVRQIFEIADVRYLSERVDRSVVRKVRKERHRVAVRFLEGMRQDFLHLEEAASIVAALSAEVDARQEWRRFRLGAEFRLKYAALRVKYATGLATSESFRELAWMVSSLAVQLERTVSEIAAGAALAQGERPSSQA